MKFSKFVLALAAILVVALGTATAAQAANPSVLPVGTEASPLSFTGKAKGVTKLIAEGRTVECREAPAEGSIGGREFTNGRLGLVIITFKGCVSSNTACTGLERAEPEGQIKVHAIIHIWAGRLVNARGEVVLHRAVIVFLPLHVHFTCGFGLVLVLVLGCVAALISNINRLARTLESNFIENEKREGINDITEVENERGEFIPCSLKTAFNEGREVNSLQTGESVAEKFKQGGREVEVLVMA
jgi:hypothetical protein